MTAPSAPLPDGFPELRPGPPWVTEEMVAAEPDLVEPLWRAGDEPARALAAAVDRALVAGEPVCVVGCGTSEHGAMAIAALLRDAVRWAPGAWLIASRQAFEAALDPWPGVCLAVSHEAGTRATIAALAAARARGAATGLVTATPAGPAAAHADHVLATPVVDRAWCHTVGYLSPLLAGALLASRVGGVAIDPARLAGHLARSSAQAAAQAGSVAEALCGCALLECSGSGVDAITAREVALKIEEGMRRPAVGRDLETVLHGHLVARDRSTGLVVCATEPRCADARRARAAQELEATTRVGASAAAIVDEPTAAAWAPAATPAGRIVVPSGDDLPALTGALTGSAMALQRLTLALVAAAGTNPDLIRREEAPYREAAELVEAHFPD